MNTEYCPNCAATMDEEEGCVEKRAVEKRDEDVCKE